MTPHQQALVRLHLPPLLKKKDRPLASLSVVANIVSFLLYKGHDYHMIYKQFAEIVGEIYISTRQFNEILQLIDLYYLRPELPESRTS